MDDLQFTSSLVHSLAWPAAIVVAVLLFRGQITRLFSRDPTGLKVGPSGLEVTWEKEIKEYSESVELAATEQESAPPLPTKPVPEVPAELEVDHEVKHVTFNPGGAVSDVASLLPNVIMSRYHGSGRSPTTDELVSEILREASHSPITAVIRLGTELEKAVRYLLAGSGWATPKSLLSLDAGVARLVELGVLTYSAASALTLFFPIRNQIVHGAGPTSEREVLRAVDVTIPLLRAVRAIPRERNFVFLPAVAIYGAPDLTDRLTGHGVILRTVSPGGMEETFRIFPTTRTHFEVGKEVAWEWNVEMVWSAAWYEDPSTKEVRQAWGSSGEFIGRNLDDIA